MRNILFLIIAVIFLLSGCVEKEVIDDINLIVAIAYDLTEDGNIRGTADVNTYMKDQPVRDYLISAESKLSRDVMSEMQKKSQDPLVIGKLQVALFGEKLAKQGISDIVDTLERDASIGERLLLAVTRDESMEILEGDFATVGAANYLTNLILHNIKSRDLPRTNLHLFLYQHYSQGQDPFLPILEKNEQSGNVEINGIVLMDHEKVVAELPNDKLLFFKVLTDQYSKGSHTVEIPDSENSAVVKSLSSSRKLKVISEQPIKVEIDIKLKGYINEYTGEKITPKVKEQIVKAFEKQMEKETLSLIEKFKELKIDPIGIGDDLRAQIRTFKIEEWRERIPELQVDVNADVTISESGVVD
ncbi:MAG TPA: Ger(x)C family spore germination protein [Metabacillus sp.]|nr:Ger(x)C family spore germination protein [Metabacillus sp.]